MVFPYFPRSRLTWEESESWPRVGVGPEDRSLYQQVNDLREPEKGLRSDFQARFRVLSFGLRKRQRVPSS